MSPLLAVAEALGPSGARLLFVGGRRGLEAELVRRAGLDFHATPLPSLRDPDSRAALLAQATLVPIAFLDAFVRIARFGPRVCLTSGGFVALPVVAAARLLRVPVYLWDGNALPGRANRLLAVWARRIGVMFPGAFVFFPRRRTVLVGDPIRASLLRWTRETGRAAFGLDPRETVVLVSGGSQGAVAVNDAVLAALERLVRRATVIHLTGAAHLPRAVARRDALPAEVRARYRPLAALGDEMGAALAAADLVVGRAGASSIAEPLAVGRPLVLIPFGAALGGHQDANARAAAETGAAVVVRESELDGDRLAAVVTGLLDDPARLARMSAAARSAGRPAAAAELARELLALGGCPE